MKPYNSMQIICFDNNLNYKCSLRILPSCNSISTMVWQHDLNFNKMPGEKARWGLQEDVLCCSEQILEVALYKTATLLTFTSQFTNHSSKVNKTYSALLEKDQLISNNQLSHIDTLLLTNQLKLTSINSEQTLDTV